VSLLWRLDVEMRRGAEFPERLERRTSRTSGVLLFGLAIVAIVSRNLPPIFTACLRQQGKLAYGDRFYGINPSCIRCDYRRQGS